MVAQTRTRANDGPQDQAAVRAAESPLDRWQRQCWAITDPAYEMTIEEFAPLQQTYRELLRAGHQFDLATIALMTVLERQCLNTDSDPDSDGADLLIDLDDSDEDGSNVDDGFEADDPDCDNSDPDEDGSDSGTDN